MHLLQRDIEANVADITLNGVSVMGLAPSEVIRHAGGWGMVLVAHEVADKPRVWIDGQRKKIIKYGWVEVHFSMIPIKVTTDWSIPANIAADIASSSGLSFPMSNATVRFVVISGRPDPSNIGGIEVASDGTITLVLPFTNIPAISSYTYTTGPILL